MLRISRFQTLNYITIKQCNKKNGGYIHTIRMSYKRCGRWFFIITSNFLIFLQKQRDASGNEQKRLWKIQRWLNILVICLKCSHQCINFGTKCSFPLRYVRNYGLKLKGVLKGKYFFMHWSTNNHECKLDWSTISLGYWNIDSDDHVNFERPVVFQKL